MPDRVYNVLFLCTGNSARSIIAESISLGARLGEIGRSEGTTSSRPDVA